MTYKQRLEVEKRLATGEESGLAISKSMWFENSMWVSAVKKNPIPGGVLDPKGKLASYEGVWVDPQCVVRPYAGLEKGKPIIKEPLDPKRGRWGKGSNPKAGMVVPFKSPAKEEGSRATVQTPTPTPTMAELEEKAPSDTPPSAHHESSRPVEDLGEPVAPSDKMKKKLKSGSKTLRQARLFSKRALPLKERIDILARLAKSVDEPQVALRAISMLNDLDGLIAAAKEPSAANLGGGPLFQLPRDMAMSFAPVGRPEDGDSSLPTMDDLENQEESGENDDANSSPHPDSK
jgi:hypothetical protein